LTSSLLASLRVVEGLLRISGATLVDAALAGVSTERSEERLRWWARRVVEATGIDLRVEGRQHLAAGESFVVMSNHQSHLDVPCLFHGLTPAMRMVAKKELFRVPLFGPAMRQAGFLEVDRNNRTQAVASLQGGRALLASGLQVWIAPEGTRSPSGNLLPFKKGGFVMALEAEARILPVGIYGTRDVLPVNALRARVGRPVGLVVGAPIATAGKTRDALMSETRDAMLALIEQARLLAAR
jgi:1-acyl-sn-glycerol-3-phosphate acyltransferase